MTKKKRERDPDGVVDRDDKSPEMHENVRGSTDGVEDRAKTEDAPTGLIGAGKMVDPRYLAPR